MKKKTIVKAAIVLPGAIWLSNKIKRKMIHIAENTLDWADNAADYFTDNVEPKMPRWMIRK